MARDENTNFLPTVPAVHEPPQTNRAVLGVLTVLIIVAVLLALWFLVFDDDDSTRGDDDAVATAGPTPVTIPTSTPTPMPQPGEGVVIETESDGGTTTASPTPAPTVAPTPLPEGFEVCGAERSPIATTTYIVDTQTTPLNQRSEPSVESEIAGFYDPGTTGLVFTGQCVVNLADGYVWWEIDKGTEQVWVASEFVTAN